MPDTVYSPPSLKELCARTILRNSLPILKITHPHILEYLSSYHECSFCGGPYLDSFVRRWRCWERDGVELRLEYKLCIAHWTNDDERIKLMFCRMPDTAMKLPVLEVEKRLGMRRSISNLGLKMKTALKKSEHINNSSDDHLDMENTAFDNLETIPVWNAIKRSP
ncbi:hypothetical protein HK096_008982, partial [Nowakowskiella sp. JEL0078]